MLIEQVLSRADHWNYRSVIRKLNYLANNIWPDISMVMNQFVQIFSNPKAIHELAAKRTARHLLSTPDKGLIPHHCASLSLNM
jgi:hypothetical protein